MTNVNKSQLYEFNFVGQFILKFHDGRVPNKFLMTLYAVKNNVGRFCR